MKGEIVKLGFDIYIRWSNMAESDKKEHLHVFVSIAEAGHLHHNWACVAFCARFFNEHNTPNPILAIYPQWNGMNDDQLIVSPKELLRLKHEKEAVQEWLDRQPEGIDDNTNHFHSFNEKAIRFITFVESKSNEEGLVILYA